MAPVRRHTRTGAVVFAALVALAGSVGGCERVVPQRDDGPRVIELAHDTIRLDAGTRLVEVRVRRDATGDFDPAHAEARTGDYVRFTADDRGGHAIVFTQAADPAVYEFLRASEQLRSPPLISAGASWVLTLDGAPPGEYPFHCTTHNAAGRLSVLPR